MRALPTLFKLAERRIEAAATVMRQLQSARDAIVAERAMLEARVIAEGDMAGQLVGFPEAYAAFLDRVRLQDDLLAARLSRVEADIETAKGVVQTAFEERTRIDVLIQREAEKRRAAEIAAQDKRLEEAALFRSARLARERATGSR